MQKSKLPQFKKLIGEMNEAALREELLKLYTKLPLVKDFYNQDLMTEEERQVVLKGYKDKIYKQFWTPKGNPKIANNAQIRSLIAEFEKIAVFPYDVIDLLIYRVETTTDHASNFGGTSDTDYNAAITVFKKAMKLVKENNLKSYFEDRCKTIFKADNLDYWYIEELKDFFDELD
jgi:hypothetical protein